MAMELLDTVHVIEDQEWLEAPSATVAEAVSKVLTQPGGRPTGLSDFLNGVWLGHPLHPLLTDVPIGAWTMTITLDGLGILTRRSDFNTGADVTLSAGLLSALAAAVTGLAQWQYTIGRQRRMGFTHALLNVAAVGLYGVSLLCRLRDRRGMGRMLATLGYGMMTVSAYIGGDLVYKERLGVTHIPEQEIPEAWQPTIADDELREGELRRVTIADVPVLVTRQQGRLYALSEICSHLGGPLAEGTVESGCVTCPWHGSRFRLRDGSIVNGPATFPQTVYETQVRDGMIEVRATPQPQEPNRD